MDTTLSAHWSAETRRLRVSGSIDDTTLPGVLALLADCAHTGPVILDLAAATLAPGAVGDALRRACARTHPVVEVRAAG